MRVSAWNRSIVAQYAYSPNKKPACANAKCQRHVSICTVPRQLIWVPLCHTVRRVPLCHKVRRVLRNMHSAYGSGCRWELQQAAVHGAVGLNELQRQPWVLGVPPPVSGALTPHTAALVHVAHPKTVQAVVAICCMHKASTSSKTLCALLTVPAIFRSVLLLAA